MTNADRGQVLHADRGPNQNENGDRELRRDGSPVRLRLGVDPRLRHEPLGKPHDLAPDIAMGDLAYELAVLLGETGRAVLLESEFDFV